MISRALEIREKALGMEHPSVANVLKTLGKLYRDQRRYTDAEHTHPAYAAHSRESSRPRPPFEDGHSRSSQRYSFILSANSPGILNFATTRDDRLAYLAD